MVVFQCLGWMEMVEGGVSVWVVERMRYLELRRGNLLAG